MSTEEEKQNKKAAKAIKVIMEGASLLEHGGQHSQNMHELKALAAQEQVVENEKPGLTQQQMAERAASKTQAKLEAGMEQVEKTQEKERDKQAKLEKAAKEINDRIDTSKARQADLSEDKKQALKRFEQNSRDLTKRLEQKKKDRDERER